MKKPTPGREWSGNALSLVRTSQKHLARAIVKTQHAIAVAEEDGDCDPRDLPKIARLLRRALSSLDCVPREVEQAVEGAAARGLPPDHPQVNGRGGDA
jgi:hypothetical protein